MPPCDGHANQIAQMLRADQQQPWFEKIVFEASFYSCVEQFSSEQTEQL